MSKNEFSYFMDRITDGGLFYLSRYLEEHCDCHVVYVSPTNRIIYPEVVDDFASELAEILKKRNPVTDSDYDPERKSYYYTYFSNEYKDKFAFYPVEEQHIERIKHFLEEIYIPVSSYLQGLYLAHSQVRAYNTNTLRKLFSTDTRCWNRYLKEQRIDASGPFFIVVMRADEMKKKDIWPAGRHLFNNLQAKYRFADIKTFTLDEFAIQFYSSTYYPEKLREGRKFSFLGQVREAHHEQFNVTVSAGIGKVHKAKYMHRSFIEAMAAHFFSNYTGKKDFECYYEDMGFLSTVLGEELNCLYSQVSDKLSALKEYDSVKNTDFYETLKVMLINDFSDRAVAQELFIHANTIYYRKERIEQILNEDFSRIEVRSEYLYNIMIYDFLEFLKARNFWEQES